MNRTRSLALAGLVLSELLCAAQPSRAAEIRIVCANPLAEGLTRLAETYKRETGNDVKVQAATSAELTRLVGAPDGVDVLVVTAALADQAAKEKTSGRTLIGRVGVGIAVRRGLTLPNISTADALKQAALGADSLVYNTAGSGQYVEKLFGQLGIIEQIKSKSTRPGNAAQTMERVLQGKGNEIGFGLMSEMKPYEQQGLQLAALPAAIQNYTNYEALVLTGAQSDAAKDFIRFAATPASKQVLAATGVE